MSEKFGPLIDWNARVRELELEFGSDITRLIFDRDFNDTFLRRFEKIYLRDNGVIPSEFIGHFLNRSRLNFPGPFYTVETDNCGIGQSEAPDNVLYDRNVREHIFRQPRTMKELSEVFSAAYLDPFQNYGINGNEHWTIGPLREWWANKGELIEFLNDPEVDKLNEGQNRKYINYLQGEALFDLKRYAFFLENGSYPCGDKY